MFNVLYDFVGMIPSCSPMSAWAPATSGRRSATCTRPDAGFTAPRATDTEGKFAYQAILGAAFRLPIAPGLSLTADYRFMGLVG